MELLQNKAQQLSTMTLIVVLYSLVSIHFTFRQCIDWKIFKINALEINTEYRRNDKNA